MSDTSSTHDLKGQRVRVTLFGNSAITGVLRGVTASSLWIGEAPIKRDDIADIEAAPLYCTVCHASVHVLHDDSCASCYRKSVQQKPTPREPCAVCGEAGVRNPGSNDFLCPVHHAEAGNKLRIAIGSANALAGCITEDISSSKHEWGQVRGARFRCIRCRTAEKWDPDLLKQIRAQATDTPDTPDTP